MKIFTYFGGNCATKLNIPHRTKPTAAKLAKDENSIDDQKNKPCARIKKKFKQKSKIYIYISS